MGCILIAAVDVEFRCAVRTVRDCCCWIAGGRPRLLVVLELEQKGDEDEHAAADDEEEIAGSCSARFSVDPSFRFVGIVVVVVELGSDNEDNDDKAEEDAAEEDAAEDWPSP